MSTTPVTPVRAATRRAAGHPPRRLSRLKHLVQRMVPCAVDRHLFALSGTVAEVCAALERLAREEEQALAQAG